MPDRTIAIGDIHGCSAALATLIDAIGPGRQDTLVLLGDYIDRGPDSRGVLDIVIDLAARCRLVPLLGNHEAMLLDALQHATALRLWLSCGGAKVVAAYSTRLRLPTHPDSLAGLIPEHHLTFLRTCRYYFENDTHLFVHANYMPDRPLEQQPAELLYWEPLNLNTARPHYSGKVVIVGHTPQSSGEILNLGFVKCIDTNCHRGGWLTGLDVHSGQIWQADVQGRLRQR